MPGSPQLSLSLRFPHQNPAHASPLPIRATCPAHLILLDFITRIRIALENKSRCCNLPLSRNLDLQFLYSLELIVAFHNEVPTEAYSFAVYFPLCIDADC
jgi:hypothetical protein